MLPTGHLAVEANGGRFVVWSLLFLSAARGEVEAAPGEGVDGRGREAALGRIPEVQSPVE